jgi:hypothetical protein
MGNSRRHYASKFLGSRPPNTNPVADFDRDTVPFTYAIADSNRVALTFTIANCVPLTFAYPLTIANRDTITIADRVAIAGANSNNQPDASCSAIGANDLANVSQFR